MAVKIEISPLNSYFSRLFFTVPSNIKVTRFEQTRNITNAFIAIMTFLQ